MSKVKRRDRYLAQVRNLQFFKEDEDCREDVLTVLDWALKNLRTEDCVLWVLGIMRRYHLATWYPPSGESLPKKDLSKRRFIFREFDMARMVEDHQLLIGNFMPNWNHYASLTEVHDSIALREMPFHAEVDGKQVALSVIGVLDGLRRLEISLVANNAFIYCEEGEDFIFLENGWKWVRIQEGRSRQEALAMGHCGNEYGHLSDVMYSLREPVAVDGEERWKPHLTFIARNDRFFGETKGRANSKPSAAHHQSIVELLKRNRFLGNRGGGYLPENNFYLLDLTDEQIISVAEANSRFEISDSRFQNGVLKHDFGDGWEIAICPLEYGPRKRKMLNLSSSAKLMVFRRVLWINGRKETLPGLSFNFDKGYLGMNRSSSSPNDVPGLVEKFTTMLDLLEVKGVTHGSLLFANCPWLPLLGNPTVAQVIAERPIFASATLPGPLYEYFGCGPHLGHALSFQHGLDLKLGSDGLWTLARFRSARLFFEHILDYAALRLLDELKAGFLSTKERQEIKQSLLHRLRVFRFGTSEIRLLLENPSTLGTACSLVISDAGLARMITEIDLPEVKDVASLLLNLVRTYDYERELELLVV